MPRRSSRRSRRQPARATRAVPEPPRDLRRGKECPPSRRTVPRPRLGVAGASSRSQRRSSRGVTVVLSQSGDRHAVEPRSLLVGEQLERRVGRPGSRSRSHAQASPTGQRLWGRGVQARRGALRCRARRSPPAPGPCAHAAPVDGSCSHPRATSRAQARARSAHDPGAPATSAISPEAERRGPDCSSTPARRGDRPTPLERIQAELSAQDRGQHEEFVASLREVGRGRRLITFVTSCGMPRRTARIASPAARRRPSWCEQAHHLAQEERVSLGLRVDRADDGRGSVDASGEADEARDVVAFQAPRAAACA